MALARLAPLAAVNCVWVLPPAVVHQDMLLWKAEVQYVCRNAARQSYGQQIRGSAAVSASLGRSKRHHDRNDL